MVQNILIGLTHRMGHYLVPNRATVDKKVLQISLTSRKCRQPHPSPEANISAVIINIQRLFHKSRTTDIRHPFFLLCLTNSRTQI